MPVAQSELLTRLHDGEFVVSAQIDPPDIPSLDELHVDVAKLQQAGVTIVDINTSRRLSHDAIWLAANLRGAFGLEVIPHISPRDSIPEGLIKQVLTASAVGGIQNFLVITGDPYQNPIAATNGYHPDSIEAIKALDSSLRQSKLALNVALGAAVNQNERDQEKEAERLQAKIDAGADFFMSQPVFNSEQAEELVFRFYRRHRDQPLIIGLWPLMHFRTIQNIRGGKVVGVEIPDQVYEEAVAHSDERALQEWSTTQAHELTTLIRETGMGQGVYIVAPLRQPGQLIGLVEKINGF